MRRAMLLAVVLLLASGALGDTPAPTPMYRVVLTFPDGSLEICNASLFTVDYLAINLTVDACYPDAIFRSGFEP